MRTRRFRHGLLAAVLGISAAVSSGTALAEVPGGLLHQGRLYDADDHPIHSTLPVRFALYDSAHAGKPVWTEVRQVSFDDGYFSVRLGEDEPLDAVLLKGDIFFLGITVGEDEEMKPRSQVGSVPFALVCGEVAGHIHPKAVSIGELPVIDEDGNWVGAPTGLVGPEGPMGPVGPEGAEGPEGKEGPMGPVGPQGDAGPEGKQGPMGPQGPRGAEGLAGPEGPMGPVGPEGPMGPVGPEGPVGPRGPEGPMGLQGPEGVMGSVGPMGPVGPEGAMGPMGPEGPDGAMGPVGPTGPDGPQGAAGLPGADGPMGPAGPQGPPGSPAQVIPFSLPVFVAVSPSATDFGFVGGAMTIWLPETSVVSGVLQAALGSSEASEQGVSGSPFEYDLCYQPAGLGVPAPFAGGAPPAGHLANRPLSWVAAGAAVLPPGTYDVGFCMKNSSDLLMDMYSRVTGYFQVSAPAFN